MSWYGAARFLLAQAKTERERAGALGVSGEQVKALRHALRIFDRATLQALIAEHVAEALESLAKSMEGRGRNADTPGATGK